MVQVPARLQILDEPAEEDDDDESYSPNVGCSTPRNRNPQLRLKRYETDAAKLVGKTAKLVTDMELKMK